MAAVKVGCVCVCMLFISCLVNECVSYAQSFSANLLHHTHENSTFIMHCFFFFCSLTSFVLLIVFLSLSFLPFQHHIYLHLSASPSFILSFAPSLSSPNSPHLSLLTTSGSLGLDAKLFSLSAHLRITHQEIMWHNWITSGYRGFTYCWGIWKMLLLTSQSQPKRPWSPAHKETLLRCPCWPWDATANAVF